MINQNKKKINDIFIKNNIDIKKYNTNVNLVKIGVIDSMQLIILITQFEKKFKIKISQKYLYNDSFGSIKSFYKIIHKIVNGNTKSKKK